MDYPNENKKTNPILFPSGQVFIFSKKRGDSRNYLCTKWFNKIHEACGINKKLGGLARKLKKLHGAGTRTEMRRRSRKSMI